MQNKRSDGEINEITSPKFPENIIPFKYDSIPKICINGKRIDSNDQKIFSEERKLNNEDQKLDNEDQKIDIQDKKIDNEDQKIDIQDKKIDNEDQKIDTENKKEQKDGWKRKYISNTYALCPERDQGNHQPKSPRASICDPTNTMKIPVKEVLNIEYSLNDQKQTKEEAEEIRKKKKFNVSRQLRFEIAKTIKNVNLKNTKFDLKKELKRSSGFDNKVKNTLGLRNYGSLSNSPKLRETKSFGEFDENENQGNNTPTANVKFDKSAENIDTDIIVQRKFKNNPKKDQILKQLNSKKEISQNESLNEDSKELSIIVSHSTPKTISIKPLPKKLLIKGRSLDIEDQQTAKNKKAITSSKFSKMVQKSISQISEIND